MSDSEISELANDIKTNGQRAPVTLLDGKILDGRNRAAACKIAGIEPKTREFPNGHDPVAFVLSANLHRRHLDASQRAMVAARLVKMQNGGDRKSEESKNQSANLPSVTVTAEALNVSQRSVKTAKSVLEHGTKAQVKQVVNGTKSVSAVAKEIKAKEHEKEQLRDDTGYAIPDNVRALWERKAEAVKLCGIISNARSTIRDLQAQDDPLYAEVNINGLLTHLNNAYSEVKQSVPHAICPYCSGQAKEKCTFCKGRGLVSKFRMGMVPEELITIRAKSCVTKS